MTLIQAIAGVFTSPCLYAAAWGMATSFALCVLLVLTKRWHGSLTMDRVEGVQKFHTVPTPRIGGVPIVLGLVVAWSKASADTQALIIPILLAGLPALIFGVLEDITKRIGVMQRLLATMASGLLAWWITGDSLTRVDLWGSRVLLRLKNEAMRERELEPVKALKRWQGSLRYLRRASNQLVKSVRAVTAR